MADILTWLFGRAGKAIIATPRQTFAPVESAKPYGVADWLPGQLQATSEAVAAVKWPGIEAQSAFEFMEWQYGSSSWIAALRYNPTIPMAQMKVKKPSQWNPSGVYTFGGMMEQEFRAWIGAGSWGKYFNAFLLGKFTQFAGSPHVGDGILSGKIRDERAQAMALAGVISSAGDNVP